MTTRYFVQQTTSIILRKTWFLIQKNIRPKLNSHLIVLSPFYFSKQESKYIYRIFFPSKGPISWLGKNPKPPLLTSLYFTSLHFTSRNQTLESGKPTPVTLSINFDFDSLALYPHKK
jgi:hypothetical protein